jgi:AcrR family transcriptional regulator
MSAVGETNTEMRPGLPRAIEGLSDEQRILWATVRLVAEKGFESVTVFDVTERAGVSRAAFYELFECKDECLFAAYEKVLDVLFAYVARAFEGDGAWPLRMRRAMQACLEACSAEPEVARMATVDAPAARPEAQRRYRNALERFVPLFIEGREYAANEIPLPPDLERMAVGGAETIISDEVVAGRAEDLPTRLPDILFAVLVPYIGPEAAAAEVRRAERD